MNIFYLDKNPGRAAQALVDQHVNKLVTETAQILSNCYPLERLAKSDCPRTQKGTPRKHSYPHHPCCRWAKETLGNFYWLVKHGVHLEYERLFRGFDPHFSFSFIEWCAFNPPTGVMKITSPPQAFDKWEHLRCNDPIEGYRKYYNVAKWQQKTLKKVWTNRKPPIWWEHNIKSKNLPNGNMVYYS